MARTRRLTAAVLVFLAVACTGERAPTPAVPQTSHLSSSPSSGASVAASDDHARRRRRRRAGFSVWPATTYAQARRLCLRHGGENGWLSNLDEVAKRFARRMLRWPDPKVGGAGAAMGTIHVTVRDPTFPGGAVDLGLVETVGIGLLDDLWPRRTCYMILSLQPARGNKVNLSPYMKDLKSAATRS